MKYKLTDGNCDIVLDLRKAGTGLYFVDEIVINCNNREVTKIGFVCGAPGVLSNSVFSNFDDLPSYANLLNEAHTAISNIGGVHIMALMQRGYTRCK